MKGTNQLSLADVMYLAPAHFVGALYLTAILFVQSASVCSRNFPLTVALHFYSKHFCERGTFSKAILLSRTVAFLAEAKYLWSVARY